jgi:heme exporter protein A
VLSAAGLYCERDERVLFSALNFSVEQGQVLQIQGANGSGKTTLLRILCGLNPEFGGEILWQGQPVPKVLEAYRKGMFYLGHSPAINKTLTPLQNLHWFCALQGFNADNEILHVLSAMGLRGYSDIPCYQMSAGQQRRVSLARMQLSAATLWILDEPFTALDKQGVADLEIRIAQFARNGGAVILTTHHLLQLECPLTVLNLDTLAGRR